MHKIIFILEQGIHTALQKTIRKDLLPNNTAVGPRTILLLGHQRCSIVQISDVLGSVFQRCASYFISINQRFQHCAGYFISINPRFQCCTSFFISANPRFSIVQELSESFGHQRCLRQHCVRL